VRKTSSKKLPIHIYQWGINVYSFFPACNSTIVAFAPALSAAGADLTGTTLKYLFISGSESSDDDKCWM